MAQKGAISLGASLGNRQARFIKYIFVPGSFRDFLEEFPGRCLMRRRHVVVILTAATCKCILPE